MPALTQPYEPNPALRALYARFFDHIRVDKTWVQRARELAETNTLVYVLRNLSVVDFLALDHVTKRHQLPRVRYANDLGLWLVNPMGKGWSRALFPRRDISAGDELADALSHGDAAALFLKRPPRVLDVGARSRGGRGIKEGDELVRTLFALQREHARPIVLVPLFFVWTQQPDTLGRRPIDVLLGPPEWPNSARTVAQFLSNYRRSSLRAGEPINLREFLHNNSSLPEDVLVRRLTYATLRRLERERRSVTGPAARDPERIRYDIVRSPRLRALIDDLSDNDTQQRQALTRTALGMLRELQAQPDAFALRTFGWLVDRLFRRMYAGIEHSQADVERIREASKNGTLVLLPSHKSHIDYLILSYTFFQENLLVPLIAAGDNLNFFPMGPLFRRSGAFFIRRSFGGDRLYGAVVDAYVRRVIRDGHPIELFLEGGRSRTGKLLPPHFGLLNMIVDAALGLAQSDVYFVPVSIGYDRIIETDSYERELTGGEKSKEDAAGLLRTPRLLRHRYGRINIQVGQFLTLRDIRGELGLPEDGLLRPAKRRAVVTRLANRAMDEINRVTAVTPGALTALVLLTHSRRGLPHEELVTRCRRLLQDLEGIGARMASSLVTPSGALRPDALREAVQMFVDAELVGAHLTGEREGAGERRRHGRAAAGEGAVYTISPEKRFALDISKNIIIHFFVERALVALAVLAPPGPRLSHDTARERVQWLSRLFKFEFRFHADAPFSAIFEQTVERMVGDRTLSSMDGMLEPGPGRDGEGGAKWLGIYAAVLRNFVEGYRVAARGLTLLTRSPLVEKELLKRNLSLGNQMFYAGEIEQRESVSKTILQNAFRAFGEQGFVVAQGEKLALADSTSSAETLEGVEASIALYLRGVLA
jgi:glycerol-3-phosphate O-acyltransferase